MTFNDETASLGRYVSADAVLLIARILASLIFILSGWDSLMHFSDAAAGINALGLPQPVAFAVIDLIVELGGGLALAFGLLFRFATLALIAHTILATFLVHHFWTMSGADAFANYLHFYKNAGIIGGLLVLNISGPGRISLEGLLVRK